MRHSFFKKGISSVAFFACVGSLLSAAPTASAAASDFGHWQSYVIADQQGYSLEVAGASRQNGAIVQVWGYWGGPNQRWQLRPWGDNTYSIVSGDNKLVTVLNSSTALGAEINQWDDARQVNQHYFINSVGDQRYVIQNVNSHLCLTVQGSGSEGQHVRQGKCSESGSIWQFHALNDDGSLVSP